MQHKSIIQLLPDNVINQIAAGEVVQRPAAAVKELIENSIDAGATKIDIIIKDGGKSLFQVIDNGKGMTSDDAMMSFTRHATSKITNIEDLFSLQTMGFRGEALASIAAVAHVEMQTKTEYDDLGSKIEISGSKFESQECVNCKKGTSIAVRGLFYNVPARQRFLKSNETEYKNILNIVIQIALIYPDIAFTLTNNDKLEINVQQENNFQRISSLFGDRLRKNLIPIGVDTTIAKIRGYIGLPSAAQKRNSHQYFFVNGRCIQHPYFNKAVNLAYDKLLSQDMRAAYFIYFEVEPDTLDVNIHPNKTEVKFENDQAIFPIILSTIKEALGKTNVTPSIDFDLENAPNIPAANSNIEVSTPKVSYNPDYNPFKGSSYGYSSNSKPQTNSWEQLYNDIESKSNDSNEPSTPIESSYEELISNIDISNIFQLDSRYIVVGVGEGVRIINIYNAHFRILYEKYSKIIQNKTCYSQQLLFAETFELDILEDSTFTEISEELGFIGFDITKTTNRTYEISAIPSFLQDSNSIELIKDIIARFSEGETKISDELSDTIAISLAKQQAIRSGQNINNEQLKSIVSDLQECENLTYSPTGKTIEILISNDEIKSRF